MSTGLQRKDSRLKPNAKKQTESFIQLLDRVNARELVFEEKLSFKTYGLCWYCTSK